MCLSAIRLGFSMPASRRADPFRRRLSRSRFDDWRSLRERRLIRDWLCGRFVRNSTPVATVVIITAIQAMVMGGALTLGAFMPAFYAFAIPAITPMVIVLLISKENSNFVLALYSIFFLLLFITIARRFSPSLSNTLRLTFEKQALVNALTEAYDQQTVLA